MAMLRLRATSLYNCKFNNRKCSPHVAINNVLFSLFCCAVAGRLLLVGVFGGSGSEVLLVVGEGCSKNSKTKPVGCSDWWYQGFPTWPERPANLTISVMRWSPEDPSCRFSNARSNCVPISRHGESDSEDNGE